jgi:hypothetical protein
MKEPKVQVGILFEPQIEFILNGQYVINGIHVTGRQVATYDEEQILWQGRLYNELIFEPAQEQVCSFDLIDVTIGINFHWERKEDQRFLSLLKPVLQDVVLSKTKLPFGDK